MTVDEKNAYRRVERTAYAALIASAISFFLIPFTLPAATALAVLAGASALVFGLLALRSSRVRDTWEYNMVGTLTERMQDEVFLRYSLIPTHPVVLDREADFVTVDNQTVRGAVSLHAGQPRFLAVYA